ncbi:hypothetical protein K0H71_08335 [Bacillus sp. IITD106]|nr:hypothetical protein [Bacillus sp. IITD106]
MRGTGTLVPVPNEPVPNEPVPNEPVPNEPVPTGNASFQMWFNWIEWGENMEVSEVDIFEDGGCD